MTFVLHFYAIYDEITGAAHDEHFPDPYKFRLSYQTYHFEIVPFSTHGKEIISIIYHWYIYQNKLFEKKINLTYHRNFRILQIPWLFLPGQFFIIV